MKTVILCGSRGTRIRGETESRPKSLVRIGEKPIIWHIMKAYAHYGFNEFILCVGYKGDMIKQYFMEMFYLNNDFTLSTGENSNLQFHTNHQENWQITIVDTGLESQTGKRIKQIEKYIDTDDFMMTYDDSLSDVNLNELLESHKKSKKITTLTGIKPPSPFGVFQLTDGIVTSFKEKPISDDWMNGGYMVLKRNVFRYISDENCAFEQEPLHCLAQDAELSIYQHSGFWTAIDTDQDIERVNELWREESAPWKLWD